MCTHHVLMLYLPSVGNCVGGTVNLGGEAKGEPRRPPTTVCSTLHPELQTLSSAASPHAHIHTRARTHVCARTHTCVQMRAHARAHAQTRAHTCTHTRTHGHVRTHTLTRAHAHMHARAYTHAHTRAHTHTGRVSLHSLRCSRLVFHSIPGISTSSVFCGSDSVVCFSFNSASGWLVYWAHVPWNFISGHFFKT